MFIGMGLNISNEGGSLERLCLGLERLCQDKTVVSICNIKKRRYIHTKSFFLDISVQGGKVHEVIPM